jgi:TPP-dependent pyruvate/acetoin dehydrogenase alpha subunit
MSIENSLLLELFKKMLISRKMEAKHAFYLNRMKTQKDIPIAIAHWGIGQEAVGIGAMSALRKEDVMIGSHRGFVEYIGKGMKPLDIFAEYLGRKHILDGKAGIQISDKENNIPGMTACIGGGYAIAVGAAHAIKKNREDRVVVISYGDGGYNQSDAHPAMVIASSLTLPVIFHVPYNHWAEYTRSEEFNPTKSVAARGVAYNIPSDSVDGQRVEVVYEAAKKAIDYVRSGKGPYIMEYLTFRRGPHWSGDNGEYMDKAENLKWNERDPIKLCKEMLIEKGVINETAFKKIESDADQIVETALNQALKLPYPDKNDMLTNVFA